MLNGGVKIHTKMSEHCFFKKRGKLPIISCKMQKSGNIQYKHGCGEVSVVIQ